MKTFKSLGMVLLGSFLVLGLTNCSGSSTAAATGTDSTGTSGGGTDSTEAATSTNALAVAFPDDLNATSLTASTGSGSASLSTLRALGLQGVTLNPEDYEDAKEEIHDQLVEDNINDVKIDGVDFQASAPTDNCFGPALFIGGTHPDTGQAVPSNQSQLPPFDLGVWTETESSTGEACIAALLNNQIGQISNILTMAIESGAGILAAENLLDGDTLPAKGASLDLSNAATEVLENSEFDAQIGTATLARASSDSSEGFPVFNMNVEATIDIPKPTGGTDSVDMELLLQHIPEVTDLDASALSVDGTKAAGIEEDDTYCGRLQQKFEVPNFGQPGGNCDLNGGITECVSISYCKDSATSMNVHMRRAQFCGTSAQVDCFDANGDVDPDDKKTDSNIHGWGNNFFYIVCNTNPSDGSGSCSHAWQAGPQDGNTRTANVTVNSGGNDGCGYYGYGPDVGSNAGDVGEIDGMICNWAGPGSTMPKTMASKVQRQCFSRNSDGILTSISTDTDGDSVAEGLAITYAPTNNCNKAANTIAYGIQNPPTDVPASQAVTNNLINLSDMSFTVPTLPVVQ